jgi:hypothetical protein
MDGPVEAGEPDIMDRDKISARISMGVMNKARVFCYLKMTYGLGCNFLADQLARSSLWPDDAGSMLISNNNTRVKHPAPYAASSGSLWTGTYQNRIYSLPL